MEGSCNAISKTININSGGLGEASLDSDMGVAPTAPGVKEGNIQQITQQTKLLPVGGAKHATCHDSFLKPNIKQGNPEGQPAHFGKPALLCRARGATTTADTKQDESPKGQQIPMERLWIEPIKTKRLSV